MPEFIDGDTLILFAVGEVRAGVNLDRMESGDVQIRGEGERVFIDLPEPEILSTSLDVQETEVYDRDQGILRAWGGEDMETEACQKAVRKIESAAREDEILERAERNAESSIRAFVESLGYEEVEFAE